MKLSNEELVNIGEDCEGSLKIALSEVAYTEEYENIYLGIQSLIEELKATKKLYEEELQKEWKKELLEMNYDYERSV